MRLMAPTVPLISALQGTSAPACSLSAPWNGQEALFPWVIPFLWGPALFSADALTRRAHTHAHTHAHTRTHTSHSRSRGARPISAPTQFSEGCLGAALCLAEAA